MTDEQKKLYEILKKFDKLCRDHKIVYYLGGGTALGAIRHRGFLPWDDDIDLYMTRKNYFKLLEVQNDFFSDDFVLVNSEKFPRYGNTIVRCVDVNSTAITKARLVDGAPKGYFVEIFILDPMPKDREKQEEWKKKHWLYAELLSVTYCVANPRVAKWADEEMYYEYKERCKRIGKTEVLKELEKELFSIDESSADEYCSRWGLRNLVYNISWFQEPRYVPFEDTILPVATYAENVLRFDYGDDWMYIPEKDNQIVHSFVQNTKIGYKYFVEEYSKYIDVEEVFDSYEDRKENLMAMYFEREKTNRIVTNLKEIQVINSIYYNIDEDELERLSEREDWSAIHKKFKIWYDNQFQKEFWGREHYIAISDNLLFYALLSIVMQGELMKARKVLIWRKRCGELTDKLTILFDFVETIRNTYIALENRQYDLAEQLLAYCGTLKFDYKEKQFDYIKLELQIGLENSLIEKDILKLKELCEKALVFWPESGELLAIYGDINYALQDNICAVQFYQKAQEKTRNGLIKMHILDKLIEMK